MEFGRSRKIALIICTGILEVFSELVLATEPLSACHLPYTGTHVFIARIPKDDSNAVDVSLHPGQASFCPGIALHQRKLKLKLCSLNFLDTWAQDLEQE